MSEIQNIGQSFRLDDEIELTFTPHDIDGFRVPAPQLARALGFRQALDLTRSIPDSEKGYELVRTPGGDQRMGYLTEAGFYRALGQRQAARIADAELRERVERFQSWTYGIVLPQIRKTGSYNTATLDLSDPLAAVEAEAARTQRAIEIAKSERAARIAAQSEAKMLTAAIERDAPLVAKAEAHTGSDSTVHRQEFAREVITWGMRQKNIVVKQTDVLRFLGHIGLFIRGERTDTGHATSDALKRGLAFTDKGTAKNGHAWATGKLTARGQDYAWKRITKYVDEHGTLELPRELRGGEPA